MNNAARITDTNAIRNFIFAGKATFTLVSIRTGTRFTYRVSRANGEDEERPYFIGVLSGSDNESHYSYMGTIFPNNVQTVRFTAKSRVERDAPSAKGFCWFLARLISGGDLSQIEFWHAGCCGACGRLLTVPESIASGLGPVCAGKAGYKVTSASKISSSSSTAKAAPTAAATVAHTETQPTAAPHDSEAAAAPSDNALPTAESTVATFKARLAEFITANPSADELGAAYTVAHLMAGRCPDGCCGPGADCDSTPYSRAIDSHLELPLKSIACAISDRRDAEHAAAAE